MSSPSLDIIMPVLNEVDLVESAIGRVLEHGIRTLFVVDGGSTDGTREVVTSVADRSDRVVSVSADRGRACQMNAGAARSEADVLLFLHCDATLPRGAVESVVRCLKDDAVAGAFHVRTCPEGPPHWSHRLLWMADVRSRYTRLPYGDQAIFVRRKVFETLGGFPELPVLEDLEFSRALRRAGRIVRADTRVEVSGRRFRDRPVTTGLLMNTIPALARLGVPSRLLARLYRPVR